MAHAKTVRERTIKIDAIKPPEEKRVSMFIPLQETVNAGVIGASGWIIGGGGLALTALWLRSIYS